MRKKQSHTQIWRTSSKNFGQRKDVLAVTLDQGNKTQNQYCWPQGFWADENYLIDSPLVLNKSKNGYKFDQLVKSLYADITERFDEDRSQHLFQPFGCDMAFVDAKINFKIMDKLVETWKELGFDKDVEIKYSSPTSFYNSIIEQNTHFSNLTQTNSTCNSTSNETCIDGWTIRRDDTFPYNPVKQTYLSGYYSARPHLKQKVREFSQSFHSGLRLMSQQVLRKDIKDNEVADILQFQTGILESLGNL